MNAVIKVNDKQKEEIIKYYTKWKSEKNIPYSEFVGQTDAGTTIIVYTSNKVMFQGVSADVDAEIWKEKFNISETKKKEKEEITKYHNVNSIGSDEVGTGDYFGPIVVTASYVKKEDVEYLDSLGVCDSKQLTDDKIKKIAPLIAKRIYYESIMLKPDEYNYRHVDNNINKIKAIMHNKMLYKVRHSDKIKDLDYIIVDEFARPARYYEYIKNEEHIQRDITFMTKAENKNLAVACASIISRYIFLREFAKMEDEIHIPLPKGAGKDVDEAGKEIVEKYGREKLKEVAKLSYKNTSRILGTLIM